MSLISEIVQDAPKAIAVVCDVGKETDIKAMVDKTVQEFDRLDVVFNNAGISSYLAKSLLLTLARLMNSSFQCILKMMTVSYTRILFTAYSLIRHSWAALQTTEDVWDLTQQM